MATPSNTALEPAAKRQKLKGKAVMLAGQQITLQSQEAEGALRFQIPEDDLLECSFVFQPLIDKPNNRIIFDSTSAETLQSFSVWLNENKVSVEGLDTAVPLNPNANWNKNDTQPDTHAESSSKSTLRDNEFIQSRQVNLARIEDVINKDIEDMSSGLKTYHESQLPWYQALDPIHRVIARLLDLYIFSRNYGCMTLALTVIIAVQRFQSKHLMLPPPQIVCKAVSELDLQDPLMQYWIHGHAYENGFDKKSCQFHAKFPIPFLLAVLELKHKMLSDFDYQSEYLLDHDWCRFHGHQTTEEQEVCEGARTLDPDVALYKKMRSLMQQAPPKNL